MIDVSRLAEGDRRADADWNEYVEGRIDGTVYHLAVWREVYRRAYRREPIYLLARGGDGAVRGVLPLVRFRSRIFGRFLISLPYVNYGGLLADGNDAGGRLLEEAARQTELTGSRHVELRHAEPGSFPGWQMKTAKVAMLLDLPRDPEELWKGFRSKLRSQIRRPAKEGLRFQLGGRELLGAFYSVFLQNMRDLGTPVHSRRFFELLFDGLPEKARLAAVFLDDLPVAAGLLLGHRGRLEIPWASTVRSFNRMSPNMMLYWRILEHGCREGYEVFDFGRSSPDSGTFRFKAQWGARPVQLYWHYHLIGQGSVLPEISPANPRYSAAIKVWQRLPLAVTRLLGPRLIRHIPG